MQTISSNDVESIVYALKVFLTCFFLLDSIVDDEIDTGMFSSIKLITSSAVATDGGGFFCFNIHILSVFKQSSTIFTIVFFLEYAMFIVTS
jgi:hypothetical protein